MSMLRFRKDKSQPLGELPEKSGCWMDDPVFPCHPLLCPCKLKLKSNSNPTLILLNFVFFPTLNRELFNCLGSARVPRIATLKVEQLFTDFRRLLSSLSYVSHFEKSSEFKGPQIITLLLHLQKLENNPNRFRDSRKIIPSEIMLLLSIT